VFWLERRFCWLPAGLAWPSRAPTSHRYRGAGTTPGWASHFDVRTWDAYPASLFFVALKRVQAHTGGPRLSRCLDLAICSTARRDKFLRSWTNTMQSIAYSRIVDSVSLYLPALLLP